MQFQPTIISSPSGGLFDGGCSNVVTLFSQMSAVCGQDGFEEVDVA